MVTRTNKIARKTKKQMGGWCKEQHNKDENNKLEGLVQRPDQMEDTRWEGQNFSEVVAPQEEEETSTLFVLYKIVTFPGYFTFVSVFR